MPGRAHIRAHVALIAHSPRGACTWARSSGCPHTPRRALPSAHVIMGALPLVHAALGLCTPGHTAPGLRTPGHARSGRMWHGYATMGAHNPKHDSCCVCIPECMLPLVHGGSPVLACVSIGMCGVSNEGHGSMLPTRLRSHLRMDALIHSTCLFGCKRMVSLASTPLIFGLGYFHHLQKISWEARAPGGAPRICTPGRHAHATEMHVCSWVCALLGCGCLWCTRLEGTRSLAPRHMLFGVRP